MLKSLIIKYLNTTMENGIIYNGTSELFGCSDSDFANDVDANRHQDT